MVESLRPHRVRQQEIGGLLGRIPGARLHGAADARVAGITHDSRLVRPQDVYLARAGERTHGIVHVAEAVAAGATVVLTDPASVQAATAAGVAAVVEVPDPRAVTGEASAWVYGDPSSDMLVLGVTGTNGKTTTAYLIDAGLRAAGRSTGLVGTIETHIAGEVIPSQRTTPEATDLQALFAVMRERGVDAVAMEVSSHALALDRVTGTRFAVAAFTNLSQDHLDFHPDMESYYAAKAMLFTPSMSARGVVNVDDSWGRRLAADAQVPVTTVGGPGPDGMTAWRRTHESVSVEGGDLTLVSPQGESHPVHVSLPGRFNLRNAALAFVGLVEAGMPPEAVAAGIAGLASVPGRMERVDRGQPYAVLVDYAHTPQAVALLLDEARALAGSGRVVAVLGCGGDRDRSKRPLMGAALATGADVAILTSDNPRSEDPLAILAAMEAGVRSADAAARIVVEPDRRVAIDRALAEARSGDVVVIAGKGHEQGQEQAGRTVPFDDRLVVRDLLAAKGFAVGVA
ncbi:MAG: UDP-N-acetylmuramoyl-L-alanyl-D-glutamate--2,6-diaminopimelate ligase [Frankiaceae bacterium]|nr:UDP-N-acetylmuramoyl-L-alanyl-D-glutamate--2,6-diaminopimelate ligase [Frankiaceae bacterium]